MSKIDVTNITRKEEDDLQTIIDIISKDYVTPVAREKAAKVILDNDRELYNALAIILLFE